MVSPDIAAFVRREASERFLRYVRIDTRSSEDSEACPSTPGQLDLARLLVEELSELGLEGVDLDANGYVYAVLPASQGVDVPPISFLAHMDTSPSESGRGVAPLVHEEYDGGTITFPADPALTLDPRECPELSKYRGETIITASGDTLLGADDKAGIAIIMAALSACVRFPELTRPELRIVFTPDEEIGRGTAHIDTNRLGIFGYTVDGGGLGELDVQTFHALQAVITFHGRNVHPGHAKNRMINASGQAVRFLASLPEQETPEHTDGDEGFYHLTSLAGDENKSVAKLILRDFTEVGNNRRVQLLQRLTDTFAARCPGLNIDLAVREQYRNMGEVLSTTPQPVELAEQAMLEAGVKPVRKNVRGGTDGARLSFMGVPCPNLFTGGMLFHSRKEWVALPAMQKSCEVLLSICAIHTRTS